MIVIFGEVIPQAVSYNDHRRSGYNELINQVCVRYGLSIGAACATLVWCFMIFFAPIAWPIAKLLDYVLGLDEGHT